jgi:hypothetical protein
MKKVILTLSIFCLPIVSLFSQNLAGKRIINGNFSMNFNNVSTQGNAALASAKNSNFTLNTSFLTGKVRENNTYTAYGFEVSANSRTTPLTSGSNIVNATSSLYSIGPAIQFGKFIKVFDQFYYAPNSTFSVSGTFGSSETSNSSSPSLSTGGFGAKANISPLNFIYQVNNNILLSMNLGSAGLTYNYSKSSSDNFSMTTNNLSVYGSVTNFSGIGAYYLF